MPAVGVDPPLWSCSNNCLRTFTKIYIHEIRKIFFTSKLKPVFLLTPDRSIDVNVLLAPDIDTGHG